MNDDFGLRLTAIDFVFDDGKPAVIDIPTISAPNKVKERLKQLNVGEAIIYQERRNGSSVITPIFPSDKIAREKLRSAREEFLPQIYAH